MRLNPCFTLASPKLLQETCVTLLYQIFNVSSCVFLNLLCLHTCKKCDILFFQIIKKKHCLCGFLIYLGNLRDSVTEVAFFRIYFEISTEIQPGIPLDMHLHIFREIPRKFINWFILKSSRWSVMDSSRKFSTDSFIKSCMDCFENSSMGFCRLF